MSTFHHPSTDESGLLTLRTAPAPDELANALPTEAINDAGAAQQAPAPIAALDALARCMEAGTLGG